MTTTDRRFDRDTYRSEQVEFGLVDDRGRSIGMRVSRWEADYTPRENKASFNGGYGVPAGHYYEADTHATRNGETYGALNRNLRAATPEALEQLITARVEGARKRYTKKPGVTPVTPPPAQEGTAANPNREQNTMSTTTTSARLNLRIGTVMERLNIKAVPQLAERMGVPRAVLYAAMQEDRDGKEVSNADVVTALAALEAEAAVAPPLPEDEDDEGEQGLVHEVDDLPIQKPAKKKGGGKKTATPAKKAPAKKASAAAPKKERAPRKAGAPKPAATPEAVYGMPTAEVPEPFSTGEQQPVKGHGERVVYGPRRQDDGSYTGRVARAGKLYNVTRAKGAKTWLVAQEVEFNPRLGL